jgi:hypothetical protein
VPKCPNTFATYAALSTHLNRYFTSSKQRSELEETRHLNVPLSCALACCGLTVSGIKELLTHLRKHVVESHEISCPFVKCNKKFCKRSSFTSHLSRAHPKLTFAVLDSRHKVNAAPESGTQILDGSASTVCTDVDSPETSDFDNACTETEQSADFCQNFKRSLALVLLKLQTKLLIPASTVQLIVDEFAVVHAINKEYVITKTTEQLNSLGIPDQTVSTVVQDMKENDLLSFCSAGDLRNEYMRNKFFKQEFHYVEPTSYLLGLDRNRKETYGQYIPIKLTF